MVYMPCANMFCRLSIRNLADLVARKCSQKKKETDCITQLLRIITEQSRSDRFAQPRESCPVPLRG